MDPVTSSRSTSPGLVLVYLIRAGIAFGFGILAGRLPNPWGILVMLAFVAAIWVGVWRLRPRACELCGKRPAYPEYIDSSLPRWRLRWWDMRGPDPKNTRWRCPPHIMFGDWL